MKEKGGHVPLSNIITAAVHHEWELFCAWYKTPYVQGGSNMTGTDLYVNKPHCAAAV